MLTKILDGFGFINVSKNTANNDWAAKKIFVSRLSYLPVSSNTFCEQVPNSD